MINNNIAVWITMNAANLAECLSINMKKTTGITSVPCRYKNITEENSLINSINDMSHADTIPGFNSGVSILRVD